MPVGAELTGWNNTVIEGVFTVLFAMTAWCAQIYFDTHR
jgi:hypothetical protein